MKRLLRGRLRVLALGAAAPLMAATALATTAAPSSAALLGSQTQLTITQEALQAGQSETLTATISTTYGTNVFSGLVVTPAGSVTFTDTTTHTTLGTAAVASPCLLELIPCTAKLTLNASQLTSGENDITATFSGDNLASGSSASTIIVLGQGGPCGDPNTGCYADVTSPTGSTEISVQARGTAPGDTIEAGFQSSPLSCTTPGLGETAVWSQSNTTVGTNVQYITHGSTADADNTAFSGGQRVCFGGLKTFTTASGTAAVQQPNGFYEGLLPTCIFDDHTSTDTNPPCVQSGGGYDPSFHIYTSYIDVPAGFDPHATH